MPQKQADKPKKSKSQRCREEKQRRILRNGAEHERQHANELNRKRYVPSAQLNTTQRERRNKKSREWMAEKRRKQREEKVIAEQVHIY